MTTTAADALRDATRAYVSVAMDLISARRENRQSDNCGLEEWVRISPDCFRLQPRKRHWWQDCIHDHLEQMHVLPQYKALIGLLEADAQLAPLLDAEVGMGTTARLVERHHIADHMLWTMAGRFGMDGQFSGSDFDSEYSKWDGELRATRVRQVWIVPLIGLSSSLPTITVLHDAIVGQLSDEEISLLLSVGLHLSPGEAPFPSSIRHIGAVHGLRIVLEHTRRVGKGTRTLDDAGAEWNAINDQAGDVLVALRIFKADRVGTSGFAMYQASWPLQGSIQVGGLKDFPNLARQYGLAYRLTADDGAALPLFFDECQKAKHCGNVGLAMRRFAYASDRSRAEDRIIDLMIAAEALFLADAEGELSFRLALRAAFFLNSEISSRPATHRFFKGAYAVRSKIAHGSTPKTSAMKALDGTACENIDAFANELERVMRIALQKAVSHTAAVGHFLKSSDWDALIVPEEG